MDAKSLLIFKAFLLFFIPCFLIITVTFNFLSTQTNSTIFYTTTGEVSNKYETPITPAGWAFAIWSIIYIFQFAIAIYMICTFFIKKDNEQLYKSSTVFPITFLIPYLFNFVFNLTWIFLFDRSSRDVNILPLTVTILIACSICLYLSVGAISCNIKHGYFNGFYNDKKVMYYSDIIIIQNGLGIYLGWTSVAQCLNISISLIHYSNINSIIAAVVGLSVLIVLVVGFVIIDLTLLDNYTRYLILPYLIIAYAIGGVISKQYNLENFAKFYVVLEVLIVLLIIIKIGFMIWRSIKPIENEEHIELVNK